jgi:FAD/FMN-containing dehydrogenase
MNVTTPLRLHSLGERLAGRVVMPGDQDWDAVRQAFNLLVDQRPVAVALPAEARDVQLLVGFAREHDLRIAPQTTGHNAAPLGDLANTILVKTSGLTEVAIDAENLSARVGAGARWRDVVPEASELGVAALHGSSPDVGIVGYSLGGGVGWYARKHGLQTNSVTAVEIVLHDGRLVRTDAENDPGLFWALRGGGGNFGVVTAIEFDLYPISEVYAGVLFFPLERASEVLHAWREWVAGTPDEITSVGRVLAFPDLEVVPEPVRGQSFAVVEAAFIGSEADGAALIEPLRALGPVMDTFAIVPPVALSSMHMDPEEPVPSASAHALVGDLPAEAIDALLAVAGPGSGSPLVSVELRQTGGALGRSAPHHGANASMPGEFAMFAVGAIMDERSAPVVDRYLKAVRDALAPYDAGHYLNFVEQPLETSEAFSESTYARLQQVKAEYDPARMFRGNHEIR